MIMYYGKNKLQWLQRHAHIQSIFFLIKTDPI